MLSTPNEFLSALEPEDLEHFSKSLRPIELELNKTIFEPEDKLDYVYFPEVGLVSIISVMLSGESVETSVVGREGACGFIEALGTGQSFSRGLVQVPGQALRCSVRAYADTYERSSTFRKHITKHLEWRFSEARQLIACTALHSTGQRLSRWLLECQDRITGDDMPLTQEFLSFLLGIQRTTVTQIAGELQERGLIRTRRGHVHILDRPGLERACCECYRTIQHFREVTQGYGAIKPLVGDADRAA